MNQEESLNQYIQSQLTRGVPAASIKQQLVSHGWPEATVDSAIGNLTRQAGSKPRPAKRSYSVIQAFKDVFSAIKANPASTGAMMLLGVVTTMVAYTLIMSVGIGMVLATNLAPDMTGFLSIIPVLIWFNASMVVVAIASAFTQTLVGVAINSGSEGRRVPVKEALVLGFRRIGHVILTAALFVFTVIPPLLGAALVGAVIIAFAPGFIWIAFVIMLVGLVMSIGLVLRLILMPVIALFEAEVAVGATRTRARQLVADSSKFVLRIMLAVALIGVALLYVLPGKDDLEESSLMVSSITSIVVSVVYVLFSAILVVFYRNRRSLGEGS